MRRTTVVVSVVLCCTIFCLCVFKEVKCSEGNILTNMPAIDENVTVDRAATIPFPEMAFLESAKSWFGMSDPLLSEYMKRILSERVAVQVKSNDLAQVAIFKNLVIVWESEKKGRDVSGQQIDLASLKNAIGHAEIEFTLNTKLKNIPKIHEYLKANYGCVLNSLKVTEVLASAIFYDQYGRTKGKQEFKLTELNNVVAVDKFHKFQGEVHSVVVELGSFSVQYEKKHSLR